MAKKKKKMKWKPEGYIVLNNETCEGSYCEDIMDVEIFLESTAEDAEGLKVYPVGKEIEFSLELKEEYDVHFNV